MYALPPSHTIQSKWSFLIALILAINVCIHCACGGLNQKTSGFRVGFSLSSCLDKASCFSLISFSMAIGFLGPYMLSGRMFGRGERLDLRGRGPRRMGVSLGLIGAGSFILSG